MTDPRNPRGGVSENLLALVHEDMPVFDSRNERVGVVRDVFMGAAGDEAGEPGATPATAAGASAVFSEREGVGFSEIFTADDEIPRELRERLRHDGFVRIDSAGLFASDRYALRDQVASVSEDGVMLNIEAGDLIKA